jgi:membrane fusion protein, multidrug efflux system
MTRSHGPSVLAATLVAASALLLACGGGKGAASSGGGAGGGMPPAQVTAQTVQPRSVALPFEFPGRLEGSREVEVRARVSGILLERSYREGEPVKKGQTVFVIDPGPYRAEVRAAEAELAQEQARVARAERDVARLRPLLAERAVSQKDVDDAASEAELARAAAQSAAARLEQARLELSYTRVTAPIAGASSRAERSEGSLVGPEGDAGLLTRISQVQPIWVRFGVADQTLLKLRQGIAEKRLTAPSGERLQVEVVLADGGVHPERGQVNFSDSTIDSGTGSVDLRAELANADGSLIPGQFVRVRLVGIERPDAILVPQRAVQQGAEGKFVFVLGADDTAEARPVQVGDWLGSDWIVESGLRAGERVIVDGTVKVQPGAKVVVVDPTPTVDPQAAPAAATAAPAADGGDSAAADGN